MKLREREKRNECAISIESEELTRGYLPVFIHERIFIFAGESLTIVHVKCRIEKASLINTLESGRDFFAPRAFDYSISDMLMSNVRCRAEVESVAMYVLITRRKVVNTSLPLTQNPRDQKGQERVPRSGE